MNNTYYTLQVLAVHYWSSRTNCIVCHHLKTFFIGKATGEDLFFKLKEALTSFDLSLHKLIMVGRDGPNINKKILRLKARAHRTWSVAAVSDNFPRR